jgi:hypothetical protein
MKKKPKKWTKAEIKDHIQRIQAAVEKQRKENNDEIFMAITPEEIEKKFKRVNSPMIVSQGWGHATTGGTVSYHLGIYNPDPVAYGGAYAHVWVGAGNIDPTIGTFLLNVDTRFPRLTLPPIYPPFAFPAGALTTLDFDLKVPSTVEKTNYIGNCCLMSLPWFNVGTYLDRAVFIFAVS